MLNLKNEFGKVSSQEILDFEITNKIKLPADYRKFLLEYNGSRLINVKISETSYVVEYLLGMHNGPLYASIYKHIDIFKNRLPFSTFPIATDPFGNLFILAVHPDSYGNVYFWDHEYETLNQDGHFTDNCTFVAEDFSEFLALFMSIT